LKDPSGLFNSSLEGNIRRAIDFHEDDEIDEKAFATLIRAAVSLNESSNHGYSYQFTGGCDIRVSTLRAEVSQYRSTRCDKGRREPLQQRRGLWWLTTAWNWSGVDGSSGVEALQGSPGPALRQRRRVGSDQGPPRHQPPPGVGRARPARALARGRTAWSKLAAMSDLDVAAGDTMLGQLQRGRGATVIDRLERLGC